MKKLFAISLFMLTLALVNCKDESTDDPTPAKTLNKSLMVNKQWKTTIGSNVVRHYFRSDGKCCLPDGTTELGTWQWLNNSDSLEEVDATLGRTVWYVEYCTDTEMKMKLSKSDWKIYTKQ
jgi:hypothetical protein